MPSFNIIKKTEYKNTFRNESIKGQFDLDIENVTEIFKGNINIDKKEWNIGLIVGSSGSGKTTIAKELFKNEYITGFNYSNKSILDEMPEHCSTEEITKIFNSVGFATVWSWLKPYHVLSNGEKMRVDLAHSLLLNKDLIVFDEFTSVVDRTVAKTASFAVQKAIRKLNKKFIAVSCHYDIKNWLEPDWVYDVNKNMFFFAQEKSKDQKYQLKLENVLQKNGVYLKNIII